ncbi:uncharacterized protein N7479_003485 [Penicillium vulpinum]|uniref:Uncharacterized protein n=1 Tax=Penicillium vulpinum TaxID=29845 RepID=A0A1V6RWV8_9EURO|nr:uncharacterized protein N7479_003485 [Penicillium vulpinum]KAJ5963609.1 hypothetical protein N7479_003485 [Penicillium vulpinum]OQE06068.1 hypothetical protein PENVUL_c020G00365 [Penicillium vulpinum]
MVGDMGSSLMSARGYDSDAQYIGSPQHADRMRASPKSPAFRRMGLHDLIEHSRERNNLEMWANAKDHDQPDTPGTPFGMHYIPTPPGSLRGRLVHPSSATENIAGQSMTSFKNEQSGEQNMFTKSLPSLHANQEELAPANQNRFRSREGFIGSSSGGNLQNLVANWAQYMGSNPNDHRAASSASLAREDPGIMVSKTRHPTNPPTSKPETRVPHLGDLDLSHRLAGTGMRSGPPSTTPSMSELPRPNRYGPQMASQENFQPYDRSGTSTIVDSEPQRQAMHHQRDASSFYSRQSSNASRGASAVQSLRVHAANAMDSLPNIDTQMIAEASTVQNEREPGAEVLKSRFVEQLDAADWGSPQVHGISDSGNGVRPHRRVSPGWMTGGRRMGYGYNLVDNAEDHSPTVGGNSSPFPSGNWHRATPGPRSGSAGEKGLRSSIEHRTDLASSAQPFTPDHGSKRCDSRQSPMDKPPTNANGEPVLTPTMWAKMKSHSVRGNRHAPLRLDLTGEVMGAGGARRAQHIESPTSVKSPISAKTPTSTGSFYVEDVDETFLSRWAKGSRSIRKQPQLNTYRDSTHRGNVRTPGASPTGERRFSMDLTTSRPSVYFDPSNDKSADRLNGEPSRSRSGRWILRFSRNRESKRRSNPPPKEPSQESPIQYEERPSSDLGRANSTRSDVAEELASAYRECIEMPGAFYGSRWASRTSLVVEAE